LLDSIQSWEQAENVKERLLAYIQSEIDNIEQTVKSGCPIGGLCQELAKQGGSLADGASKILNDTLLWVEKQFQDLGLHNSSRELALQFVATIQGNVLLTHTFKDPKILMQLKPSLSDWIDKASRTKNAIKQIEKMTEFA
jgi:TetR/AcrR family transcriptional repressor of nem operon